MECYPLSEISVYCLGSISKTLNRYRWSCSVAMLNGLLFKEKMCREFEKQIRLTETPSFFPSQGALETMPTNHWYQYGSQHDLHSSFFPQGYKSDGLWAY